MAEPTSSQPLIGISATNPCHLYDLACALHRQRELGAYHSGYPKWRLRPPADMPVRTHSFRTLVTYGWRRLPHQFRPADARLFRWQDSGFDRAVAHALQANDGAFFHALPGQARDTFLAARRLGIKTVLNHASGPTKVQAELLADEYQRTGLELKHPGLEPDYRAREDREYELADFHAAASTIVRDQLVSVGVRPQQIWIVPYAADTTIFHRPGPDERDRHRIIFAGQLTQRKGLRVLFEATEIVRRSHPVQLDLFGPIAPDIERDLAPRRETSWIKCHGAVRQPALADAMRRSALLVLPSWEEAFGLVVPQALNCGLPCIVSDRVGARDLIETQRNGSVFPAGDAPALAREIAWWLENPAAFASPLLTWDHPARMLLEITRRAST